MPKSDRTELVLTKDQENFQELVLGRRQRLWSSPRVSWDGTLKASFSCGNCLREYNGFIERSSLADDCQNYLENLEIFWCYLNCLGPTSVSKGPSRSVAAVYWVWSAVEDNIEMVLVPPPSCSAVTPLPILSRIWRAWSEQRPYLECRPFEEVGSHPETLLDPQSWNYFHWYFITVILS